MSFHLHDFAQRIAAVEARLPHVPVAAAEVPSPRDITGTDNAGIHKS